MKTFDDISFHSRIPGIWEGAIKVGDGFKVNVSAGRGMYCSSADRAQDINDFSCFEVSIVNNEGRYVTKEFIDDGKEDILGYQTREQITKLIQKVDLLSTAQKVQQLSSIERKLNSISFNLMLFLWIYSASVILFIAGLFGLVYTINSAIEAGY